MLQLCRYLQYKAVLKCSTGTWCVGGLFAWMIVLGCRPKPKGRPQHSLSRSCQAALCIMSIAHTFYRRTHPRCVAVVGGAQVEMFVLCTPAQSEALHEQLRQIEVELFSELGLHFKVTWGPEWRSGGALRRAPRLYCTGYSRLVTVQGSDIQAAARTRAIVIENT